MVKEKRIYFQNEIVHFIATAEDTSAVQKY